MAKVKTPLLSFSASGQIAETLVYFDWKGLDVVRSYAIPANPKTAGQQAQRSHFTNAVNAWHTVPLTATDVAAWNRYAPTLADIMSGFNAFMRSHIDLAIVIATPNMGFAGDLTDGGPGLFDATITEDGGALAVALVWGFSPTSLINSLSLTELTNVWSATGIAAISGARVYGRFTMAAAPGLIGETGIFTLLIT